MTAPGVLAGLLGIAPVIAECGSAALLPDASGQTALALPPAPEVRALPGVAGAVRERTVAPICAGWPLPMVAGVDLLVDPARGRFVFDPGATPVDDIRVRYRVGMAGPIGAGAFGREIDVTPATVHWADRSSAAGIPVSGSVEIDEQ